MSFGLLSAVLVLLYWIITKKFFPELSGAEYFLGLALCVMAAMVFGSKKESPEGDNIVFRAVLPITGTVMVITGLWLYSAPEDITPTDGSIALVSEPFPEEIFTVACITTGSIILIMSVIKLLRK